MGISSLPSPSEDVLSIILFSTIYLVKILRTLVQSIFTAVIRIRPARRSSLEAMVVSPSDRPELPIVAVEMRSQVVLAVQFRSLGQCPAEHDCDCSVCLCGFEPESEVSRLPCGHFFHTGCFEKWLECWKLTCPLCRRRLLN